MKNNTHFHKYERMHWPKSGRPFYKCMMPGCSHYLTTVELAIGRESLCWGPDCNKLVVITKDDVWKKTKKPMCDECKAARQEQREALGKI